MGLVPTSAARLLGHFVGQMFEITPLDPAEVGQDWSIVLSVDEFLVLL